MGYIQSSPLFCATIEEVKYRALNTLHATGAAPEHPLETLVEAFPPDRDYHKERQEEKADDTWIKLPPELRRAALAHIEVYLDDFLGVIQGGPVEQTHMTHHLFRFIDELFRPNNPQYRAREEPISLKKSAKGYARRITTKTVLGWEIDTMKLVLNLPQTIREKMSSSLEGVTKRSKRIYKQKWFWILGLLQSAVPEISGATVMFSRLYNALETAEGRRVLLTAHVQDKLNLW